MVKLARRLHARARQWTRAADRCITAASLNLAGVLAMAEMKINGDRLWASLMEMAKIGATPKGGVCAA